jgi:hypothetical protein
MSRHLVSSGIFTLLSSAIYRAMKPNRATCITTEQIEILQEQKGNNLWNRSKSCQALKKKIKLFLKYFLFLINFVNLQGFSGIRRSKLVTARRSTALSLPFTKVPLRFPVAQQNRLVIIIKGAFTLWRKSP